jgi:SAM-dependent methyltransferase
LNQSGKSFGEHHLDSYVIKDRKVLEVGACDINGSLRAHVEQFGPTSYLGTDIVDGPGVDRIAHVERLPEELGETYDVIISTEVAEHVRDWRAMVWSMKATLNPGGHLLLTTRSKRFYYHGYPHDWWRYEAEDMTQIFRDMEILALEPDPLAPGIFVFMRKPEDFAEADLSQIRLYSIVKWARSLDVSDAEYEKFKRVYPIRQRFWKIWPKILRFGYNTDWA